MSIRATLAARRPGTQVLSDADVREIRAELERNEYRCGEWRESLGRRYGVGRHAIDAIASGTTWTEES